MVGTRAALAQTTTTDSRASPSRVPDEPGAWLTVRPVFMGGIGGSLATTYQRGSLTRATVGPHVSLLAQIGPLDVGLAAGLDAGTVVNGTLLAAAVRGPFVAFHLGLDLASSGWNCLSAGLMASVGPTWFDTERVAWRGGLGPYAAMRIGQHRVFVQGEFELPGAAVTVSAGFTWMLPILPSILARPR